MFQITVLVALKVYILYLKSGVVSGKLCICLVSAGACAAIQFIYILAAFGHSHVFCFFFSANQLQVRSKHMAIYSVPLHK